jgi:hypothetical protein
MTFNRKNKSWRKGVLPDLIFQVFVGGGEEPDGYRDRPAAANPLVSAGRRAVSPEPSN